MAENNLIVYKVQVDAASGKVAIEGLTKGFVKASTAVTKLKGEMDSLAAATQGVGTSSGIAGAFVNELGRTISDLPYGIQAISNNVSQLGSLFAVMVVSAGGVKKAIESLGATLKSSPLLLGLLAFQGITAAITYFDQQTTKAARAVKELSGQLSGAQGQIAILKRYERTINESQESSVEYQGALAKLKKDGFDPLIGSVEEYIKAKSKMLIFEAQEKVMSESLTKLFDKRAELEDKRQKLADALVTNTATSVVQAYSYSGKAIDNINKTARDEGKKTALEAEQNLSKQINDIDAQVDELLSGNKKRFDDAAKSLTGNRFLCLLFGDCGDNDKRRKRLFKQNLLDFNNEIESFNEDSEVKAVEFEEQKLAREVKYARLRIQNEYDLFLEKEKIRYLDALGEAKTSEEKIQIEETWDKTKKQAKVALADALVALDSSTASKQEVIELNKQARIRNIIMQAMGDEAAFKIQMATNDFNRIDAELEAQKIAHETRMGLLEEERQARIDAGLETSEVDAKINSEKNDNAYKTVQIQRKLELSKLDVIRQVGQAAVDIAGEGSAIGKAVAVAMAIMNTREAITAALGSKPYGPWNIAQAVAVGAAGFAQVKGIINQPLPVAGKGSSASAPSVQAPDFNIVGANSSNQLASAIQGQFNNPIKAYVVAKDVSTAQELDRNVVNAASIG